MTEEEPKPKPASGKKPKAAASKKAAEEEPDPDLADFDAPVQPKHAKGKKAKEDVAEVEDSLGVEEEEADASLENALAP